jgi:hypothetical protein
MANTSAATAKELRYEKERSQFHQLLITNPNYFGNLKTDKFKPVLKLVHETSYEELTCVSFNPLQNLLEAHVRIKLDTGYGGDLCHPGTLEYVRFYVDYGAGWQDAGLVAFDVHDIAHKLDCAKRVDKPLSYVASIPYAPQRDACNHPVLPKVRAILSWHNQPLANQPNWSPIWGNVLDQHVQIPPRQRKLMDVMDMIALQVGKVIELPLELLPVKEFPIPIPEPDPPPFEELVKLYASASAGRKAASTAGAVQAHRLATADIAASTAASAFSQGALLEKVTLYKSLGLDYAKIVVALAETQADVSYEEIECLGLDTNRGLLAATFKVKRPFGYSGQLCSYGSFEHIAFWADWDNTCKWTYLGTTSIKVHDFDPIPGDGLAFTATLKVNLAEHGRSCHEPKMARIRAVLSWSTPPSTTNPDALTTWGNRADTHVVVPPAPQVLGPGIAIIGGVGVADINISADGMTKPNAKFALYGTPADPFVVTRECPFGGLITIQGAPPVSPSPIAKYRVWVQNITQGLAPMKLTRKIWVVDNNGVGSYNVPNPADGFFNYLGNLQNIDDLLAYWDSAGDDKWAVWLEFGDASGNPLGTTGLHSIQLDNTGPATDIHISSGGDCKDFVQDVTITGAFTATDLNFGHYEIHAVPLSMSPNPVSPTSGTAPVAGGAWSLDTSSPSHMAPCGYVVELRAYDRSIVGSQPGSWNSGYDDVGLCLRVKS